MKNRIKTLACGTAATLAVVSLSHSLQAQDITGSTSSVSSWNGSPTVLTGPTPQTGDGGSTQDNDSWGGNANGTGGFGALGETFELSSAGTLENIQLVLNGSAATFNVELYDLGPYPSGYPSTPQQLNDLGGSGGADLLQLGDSFTFNGTASPTLETLTFGGADGSLQLAAGELYMVSLDPTGADADGTWWQRGGVPTDAYSTGMAYNADGVDGMQNFEGKTGSGLTGVRDLDMAVTVVPEPSTLGLFSMGGLAWLMRRRKA